MIFFKVLQSKHNFHLLLLLYRSSLPFTEYHSSSNLFTATFDLLHFHSSFLPPPPHHIITSPHSHHIIPIPSHPIPSHFILSYPITSYHIISTSPSHPILLHHHTSSPPHLPSPAPARVRRWTSTRCLRTSAPSRSTATPRHSPTSSCASPADSSDTKETNVRLKRASR